MTSSSDGEYQRRRLFVHGVPQKCSHGSIATFFATFGQVSAVHNSKHGYAFVTFEEEEAADKALAANGALFHGRILSVEFSHCGRHPPQPVTGAKRTLHFPRPFGGRGGGASGSGGRRVVTPTNGVSRGSRDAWAYSPLAPPAFHNRLLADKAASSAAKGQHTSHARCWLNGVRVVHCEEDEGDCPSAVVVSPGHYEEMPERYAKLFSLDAFPHIARVFFQEQDSATLLRCRLVCRTWRDTVCALVETMPTTNARLRRAWRKGICSYYPLTPSLHAKRPLPPSVAVARPGEGPAAYRNVLAVRADETEIVLAVDNGNVEIYDRRTLRLKTALVGQFACSPVALDLGAEHVLVGYAWGFRRVGRKHASTWNVYDRRSKELLVSMERYGDDDLRLGFSGHVYLVSPSAVFSVWRRGDRKGPSRTRKVFAAHELDTIESLDLDHGHSRAVAVVRQNESVERRLLLRVWRAPAGDAEEESADEEEGGGVDYMTRLEAQFPALEGYAEEQEGFVEAKCKCMSVQLRYPICMAFFSNAYGYFEYFEDRGRPYSLFAFYDVLSETRLRVLRVDEAWMRTHEVVPYDYDSGVLSARFSRDRLALGFGSFSNRRDGGLAVFSMKVSKSQQIALQINLYPSRRTCWILVSLR